MKKCNTCKKMLSFESFHRFKDGYKLKCKICTSEYNKEYRAKNIERERQRDKDYYHSYRKNNPKHISKNRECARKWANANKEKVATNAHKWYLDNIEKRKEYISNWAKNNKNRRIATEHKRRAAKRNNGNNNLTYEQIIKLKKDIPYCVYCNRDDIELTVDHIKPISKGGQNTLSNIAISCSSCNSSKGNKTVEEFLYTQRLERC